MDNQGLGWFDQMVIWGTLIAAWAFGEGFKVTIAGAAGGFIRWLMDDRRRFRDGAIAVVTGSIFATYFTPLGMHMMKKWFGPFESATDDVKFSAAFAMGIGGMSLAKLVLALFEAYVAKVKSEGAK